MVRCGLEVNRVSARRYSAEIPTLAGVEVLFQRSSDIPIEVEDGSVDLGITGIDRFRERRREYGDSLVLYENLEFGNARLVIAVPESWLDVTGLADLAELAIEFRRRRKALRIATKYPRQVQEFLRRREIDYFTLVAASGGLEVAPMMGYADLVADISVTGTTLRENRLRPLKDGEVFASQASLLGNGRALGTSAAKLRLVREILERIESSLEARRLQRITANIQGESREEVGRQVSRQKDLAGLQGPTIGKVFTTDGKNWFAVQVIVPKKDLLRAVDHFRRLGASGITVNEATYVFQARCGSFDALIGALKDRGWLQCQGYE